MKKGKRIPKKMKKKEFPSRTGTETKSLPYQDGDSWIKFKITLGGEFSLRREWHGWRRGAAVRVKIRLFSNSAR